MRCIFEDRYDLKGTSGRHVQEIPDKDGTVAFDDNPLQRLRLWVITTAAFSAALGFVVLIGWYAHSAALIQVYPTFVPMQYNTAASFLLCGLMVLGLAYNRHWLALACGVVVTTVGTLTLTEYIFGINIGIDQLMMQHYITLETSNPGRMAPTL